MARWGASAFALLAMLAVPSIAGADIIRPGDLVTLTRIPNTPGLGDVVVWVHNNSAVTPDFISFCLEGESPGIEGQFLVERTGSRAFDGGGDVEEPSVPGDPISPQTAFLYYSFRTGVWGPPEFVGGGELALIQAAIYCLEDELQAELCSGVTTGGVPVNPFYAFALTTTWTDIGPVRVMTLVDPGTLAPQQDRLFLCEPNDPNCCAPGDPACGPTVPEPGTMLLLGSGLVGLAAAVRRRRRNGRRS